MAEKKQAHAGTAGMSGGLSAKVIKADGTVQDLGAIKRPSLASRILSRIRTILRRQR